MIENSDSNMFNFFRFKEFPDNQYLLTNDAGRYLMIDGAEFISIRETPGKISKPLYDKLNDNGFINNQETHEELVRQFRKKNLFLNDGPSLHIVVVTLRCDHRCVYCQASRKDVNASGFDMSIETAEKTVDFILQSNTGALCIEFQGGEPLLNFDAVKHIIEYTKSKRPDKDVIFSIVTNLSYMTDEKLQFLTDHDVSICTSLDGPKDIHNKYRVLSEGDSFENATGWIRKIHDVNMKKDAEHSKFNRLNALLTVSRELLHEHTEVVDLYSSLGFQSIHLRPLNPFGYGKKIGGGRFYSPEEFLAFYRETLDYIIEINKTGTFFLEKTAQIFLKKIISGVDANFLDLRSPCGAGIGQLAYNYDGNIFTCDEARMVFETGDDIFHLGNVHTSAYREIIRSEKVRAMCIASCLEGLAGCHDCVYNPYCGVCPVYNYVEQGNIFGVMPTNDRCKIYKGIQDYLFSRIKENATLFNKWIDVI